MKHIRPALAASFLLLASGCSSDDAPKLPGEKPPPERSVSCQAGADCEAKWTKAEQWVKANSPYAITVKNEELIETAGPEGINDTLAFTIIRKPRILNVPGKREGAVSSPPDAIASANNAIFDIVLSIHCNDWLKCVRPKREAAASFANVIMGPVPPQDAFGIKTYPISPQLQQQLGAHGLQGVVISEVMPKSPAAKAGLFEGDIVVQYDGSPVTSESELLDMIAKTPAGVHPQITVIRGVTLK